MRLNTLQPIEWPQSKQSLMWLRSSLSNRMETMENTRSTSSHQPERLTLYNTRLVTQHHKIFDTQTTIDYSVQRISPSYLIECILEIYRFAHPIRLVVSFLFSE